jgi:hypothetical protein
MPNPLRAAGRSAFAALLILATATCTGDPTGPGRSAQVRFTPVLSTGAAGFGLPLDNVTVTVVRPPAETLTVVNSPFDAGDSTLQLDIPVELLAESEDLEVTLELFSGTTLLFTGTETIQVTTAPGGTTPPAIPLDFVGPGATIAFLNVIPNDTVLTFGDSLIFGANASNALEQPVTQFYLRWSTTSATVPIRSDGLIVAPAVRQTIRVAAWTPSGEVDTTDLTFVPVPTQLLKISGDLQTGAVGDTLSSPFVVEVRAADNLPVSGIAVTFGAVTAGGVVLDTVVTTDSVGRASVLGILGGVAQAYSYSATIAGVTPVTFQATASVAAVDVVIVSGTPQTDTVGRTLPQPFVVEVREGGTSTPVPGKMVYWSILYGGGSLGADSTLTDSLGRAEISYTLDTILALGSGFAEVLADVVDPGADAIFQVVKRSLPATQVVTVTSMPDTVQAGVIFTPQPVVRLRDQYGNNVALAGVTIHAITNSAFSSPLTPTLGPGGLMYSGSVVGTDTVLTDANGVATFSGLAVEGTVGPEVMRFRVPTQGGVSHALQNFTIVAGAPNSVIPITGNGQTAFVDSAVAIAPEVLVVDFSGNPVAGVQVDFVVTGGGGNVTGGTAFTDSLGHAAVGSWTMGSSPGPNTLEAQVSGVSSATFTATANPATPTIILELVGTNVVGVGRTASLRVRLTAPDTAGVIVSLNNLNPGVVTLDTASASFGPVDTMRFRVLTGVSAGSAEIIASAPGFNPDTITVTGSLNLITLPTTSNVAFGQTASLPVQLALPAPAGGVVVNVTSLDPTRVSVLTPTVTFNSGEQLKNATVSGVAVGSAAVVAEEPNYAPDTSVVSTTASLNIVAGSVTAFSTFGAQIVTEFRSAGSLTPAPAGGITVTLTPRNPACVAAPASTVIPQGQTSVADSIDYGGSAGLPCTTYLVAEAPGIDPDSINVTINPPPTVSLSAVTTTVGSGMQDGNYSATLAVSTHGGRLVRIRSLTPGVVVVQADAATVGTDSLGHFVPNGSQTTNFYIGGIEGLTNDSALVVAEASGFTPDTMKVYVKQGAFDLQGVPGGVNVLGGNSNVYVQMGVPNVALTSMNAYQGPRVGGTMPRVATVTVLPGFVAQLHDTTALQDSIKTVTFPVGQYYTPTSLASGGLQIDPLAVGSASVTATVPGLIALPSATRPYVVSAAGLSLTTTVAEIGSGLQDGTYSAVLSGTQHGGTTVKIRLLTPGVVGVIQPNATTVGTDSIDVAVANGQNTASFYLAGLEGIVNDSVSIVAEAPGFISDTMKLRVRQPAMDLQGVPGSTGSLSGNNNIYVQIGIANIALTSMNAYQGPRFGGTLPRVATVNIAPGTVAILRDSTATPDSTKTVTIPVGQYYSPTSLPQGLQVDPLTPGTATLVASMSGFSALPSATRTMVVNGPAITLPGTVEIGSGLQDGGYTVSLGASAHGGVTLTLRTLTPGVALLQLNGTTAGDDTLTFVVPDGTGSRTYWIGGLEGIVNDSTQIVAEIPGFAPDTQWVRVRRPAFDLQGVPGTTTTLSTNSNVYVQMGVPNIALTSMNAYQGSRFGGSTSTFHIRSDAPTVVRMVDSATAGDSLPVTVPAGQYYSPTSVSTGGLGIDPLTTGSVNIVATHPVFTALPGATRTITVSTPAISTSGTPVGSGLQVSRSFNLGAPQHGGVNVVVKSSAPGILKVSPNSTTPGTDSIIVFLANGNTSGAYYVQGMEDSTGSPTVSVSAPGFTDGSAGYSVVQPAIDLQAVPTNIAQGAANAAIYAQIGVPNGPVTTMNDYQEVRAGAPSPVTVTFTNSSAGVLQLVTTALTADIVTALIASNFYYSPTSVATGGAAIDPLTVGTRTITVSAPGFLQLPGATRTVNVTP